MKRVVKAAAEKVKVFSGIIFASSSCWWLVRRMWFSPVTVNFIRVGYARLEPANPYRTGWTASAKKKQWMCVMHSDCNLCDFVKLERINVHITCYIYTFIRVSRQPQRPTVVTVSAITSTKYSIRIHTERENYAHSNHISDRAWHTYRTLLNGFAFFRASFRNTTTVGWFFLRGSVPFTIASVVVASAHSLL